MVLDELTEFADATTVSAGAGTALIGDVIPLTNARDMGVWSKPCYFVITVDTEIITGGTAGTVLFKLVSDAQAAIAVDQTATVHITTGSFATGAAASNALLKAGAVLYAGPLPMEGPVYEAYLGVICTTGTTTTTAGKINAFFTPDVAKWKSYADAI